MSRLVLHRLSQNLHPFIYNNLQLCEIALNVNNIVVCENRSNHFGILSTNT